MPKLPVVVLNPAADSNMPLVLSITGDGGFIRFDPVLANQFVKANAPVVALSSFRYFLKKKTPEQTTAVIEKLLRYYMEHFHKKDFILEGYSFGADVMPFIVNCLPYSLLQHCKGVALFSPGTSTNFKIHLIQMLGIPHRRKYSVVDEIEAMKSMKTLFFFGEKEHRFPVGIISKSDWQIIYLKGGHSYQGEKGDIGKLVLEKLGIG